MGAEEGERAEVGAVDDVDGDAVPPAEGRDARAYYLLAACFSLVLWGLCEEKREGK